MTKKQKSVDHKMARRAKLRQRRLLTFIRMCRYGVSNFSRNAWLTVAATAVMSITLIIILMTMVARQVLLDTVAKVAHRTNVSIYLKGSTDQRVIRELTARLKKLQNVEDVSYISAEEARQEQARSYQNDPDALDAIRESHNEMSATLRISVRDLNDRTSLNKFIQTDELYKQHKDPRKESSFSGEKRRTIDKIGDWVRIATVAGSIATTIFVIISSLVVFNTIRMAIFNRKDEIQMMKLIGAERGFIRGPFIVEAVMYGFIAAIIASVAGYSVVMWLKGPLTNYDVPMTSVVTMMTTYLPLVVLAMIGIGALIGVVSSWIATRKYLKL